jgi:hypothetical protein
VEDFDEKLDGKFIKEFLIPYLKDLYKDVAMRSILPGAVKEHKIDKVSFI